MEKILRCPFCGSDEIEICRTNENACWIRCAKCGADAPPSNTREQAISNWNKRYRGNMTATIVDDGDKDFWDWMKKYGETG